MKTSLLLAGILLAGAGAAQAEEMTGRDIAFDRRLGNCLACHAMTGVPDSEMPGDIGPPLTNMKQRYPDKAKLRAQIWDAGANNPRTAMPPFGRHKILTEKEIDKLTDFVYGL
jgi:sulfur-oxidizing protein SoxX